MIDPELEMHPHNIIAKGKRREAKFNFVKSVFLDIFLVFYSLIVIQRAIYYKFILDLRYLPFSWNNILIIVNDQHYYRVFMDLFTNITFC